MPRKVGSGHGDSERMVAVSREGDSGNGDSDKGGSDQGRWQRLEVCALEVAVPKAEVTGGGSARGTVTGGGSALGTVLGGGHTKDGSAQQVAVLGEVTALRVAVPGVAAPGEVTALGGNSGLGGSHPGGSCRRSCPSHRCSSCGGGTAPSRRGRAGRSPPPRSPAPPVPPPVPPRWPPSRPRARPAAPPVTAAPGPPGPPSPSPCAQCPRLCRCAQMSPWPRSLCPCPHVQKPHAPSP